MTRIVRTSYRYKRPPRKRKPIEIEGPAVVRKANPGNDNRAEAATSQHDATKSAIVSTTSKKRLKLLRADKRTPSADSDPEMRAWLLRAMQGGWPR